MSLYAQTITLVCCYLTAVALAVGFFFSSHIGGWEAILRSPIGDRADQVASAIHNQLLTTNREKWTEITKNFGQLYNVKYYIFDFGKKQLAGETIELPQQVANIVSPFPPPPHGKMGIFVGRAAVPFTSVAPLPAAGAFPTAGTFSTTKQDFHIRVDGPPPMLFATPPLNAAFLPALTPNKPSQFTVGKAITMLPPFSGVHGRFVLHTQNPDTYWIGERAILPSAEGGHLPGVILARMENPWTSSLIFDFKMIALVILAIIALTLLFWLPFVWTITRPLSRLTRATERIASGKFNVQLKTKRRDEIGRLTEAVNTMSIKLNHFVEGQKGFLGAISHELFSPLARLGLALELLESSATREQKRHIDDIRDEVTEMNQLVNELLAYAKAGMNERKVELKPVDLNELIESLSSKLQIADKVNCKFSNGNVIAEPFLLERALSNILRNAVRYGGEKGLIEIETFESAGKDQLIISISDRGPGVPESAIAHLGEPFYRPESSRTRESGGVGLGLAIVKTCIEACEGTLIIKNRAGGGLCVSISLKRASAESAVGVLSASGAMR